MRRLLGVFALALSIPLAACGSTEPEEGIAGEYLLETVDGGTLPWLAVQVDADKIEVLSGSVRLGSDGTFADLTTFKITEAGVASTVDDIYTGTWLETPTGATLTILSPEGFDPYEVAIQGDRLSQVIGDVELVYRR
jgi:hypothetical protein